MPAARGNCQVQFKISSILGMPPGGGVDSYARLVQRHLGRFLSRRPRDHGAETMPGAGSLRSVMALVNSSEDVIGTLPVRR